MQMGDNSKQIDYQQMNQQNNGNFVQVNSERAISPHAFMELSKHPEWIDYRQKLEEASKIALILKLTIQSSATLTKGDEILINTLGLLSQDSKRTIAKITDSSLQGTKVGDILDMRDGLVYFGCKKSIKQPQSNLDNESTTIVSRWGIPPLKFQ